MNQFWSEHEFNKLIGNDVSSIDLNQALDSIQRINISKCNNKNQQQIIK